MGTPVRLAPAVIATALLATPLSATACGSDNPLPDLGEPVTVTPPPAAAPIPDDAKLTAALLSAQQLPAGFGALADPSELGLPSDAPAAQEDSSTTDPAECAAVLAPVAEVSTGSQSRALARFQGLDFTSIDIDAASYPHAELSGAFAHLQDLFAKCTEYSGKDAEDIEVSYRLGQLDFPPTGDASVAVRLLTESEGVTLTTDVVVMVIGTTIVQFTATGPEPIDKKVFNELVAKQAEQIRSIN
jgi:hypothetical protein